MNGKIKWIARTAMLLALVVVVQYIGKIVGGGSQLSQYIAGSLVNLILVTAAALTGPFGGAAVALVSPLFAQIIGIGPGSVIPMMIPVIMLGNLAIVLVMHAFFRVTRSRQKGKIFINYAGAVTASVVKFGVLFLTSSYIVKPFFVPADVPPVKADTIIAMFSYPQLVTALIGSIIAVSILPTILKAIKK